MLFIWRLNSSLTREKSEAIKVMCDLEEHDQARGMATRLNNEAERQSWLCCSGRIKVNFDAPDRHLHGTQRNPSDQPDHSSASTLKTMRSMN